MHGHNDMHPPENALFPGFALDLPSSLLGGEALLAKVYNAVRTSASPTGSNVYNTLLMINFDEHGGTYDHVPPPPVPPPDPAGPAGQYGFTFDRSGIRVPAIAISPWIAERTVVNDEHRHTSVIRTLRERWSLGAPFTARDAIAPDLAPLLALDTPRAPEDWPDVTAQPVPVYDQSVVPLDKPLTAMQKGGIFALLALGKDLGHAVPDTPPRHRSQRRRSHRHARRPLRAPLPQPDTHVEAHRLPDQDRPLEHTADVLAARHNDLSVLVAGATTCRSASASVDATATFGRGVLACGRMAGLADGRSGSLGLDEAQRFGARGTPGSSLDGSGLVSPASRGRRLMRTSLESTSFRRSSG